MIAGTALGFITFDLGPRHNAGTMTTKGDRRSRQSHLRN